MYLKQIFSHLRNLWTAKRFVKKIKGIKKNLKSNHEISFDVKNYDLDKEEDRIKLQKDILEQLEGRNEISANN